MNRKLKRQAALFVLFKLVDENEGFIDINSDVMINSYSDENHVVKVKFLYQKDYGCIRR